MRRRGDTAAEVPVFGHTLANGDVSAEHVDLMGAALRAIAAEKVARRDAGGDRRSSCRLDWCSVGDVRARLDLVAARRGRQAQAAGREGRRARRWQRGQATPDEFARRLRDELRRLDGDDGTEKHKRQKSGARLWHKSDSVTGMGKIWMEIDPLSYAKFVTRNDAMVARCSPSGARRVPE